MSAIVNDREVRVIGMSRSGNHAIIGWITGQFPGRTCFLNCCEGKANPFASARPLPGGSAFEASYPVDMEGERRGEFSRKDLLIYNYEDSFLAHACSEVFERRHDEWVGRSRERLDIVILRDPFNLFASRFRRRGMVVKSATALRIWKQHARQFVDERSRGVRRPVLINYNRWFASREYRSQLAERLSLRDDDAGIDRVPGCFGGSSFDEIAMDGRAQRMRVLERWRHFQDDPAFAALFDEQIIDLSNRIFGPIPGVAEWLGLGASGVTRRAG